MEKIILNITILALKGLAHGRGIWIKDFNIYIGSFKNDNFNGTGVFINEQGY
jgi:hypothetical protein